MKLFFSMFAASLRSHFFRLHASWSVLPADMCIRFVALRVSWMFTVRQRHTVSSSKELDQQLSDRFSLSHFLSSPFDSALSCRWIVSVLTREFYYLKRLIVWKFLKILLNLVKCLISCDHKLQSFGCLWRANKENFSEVEQKFYFLSTMQNVSLAALDWWISVT